MDALRFDGRVAVVTGAGRGLGRAHARLFAERGASVVVNDNGSELDGSSPSPDPADQVVAEIIAAGSRAVASYGSVADYEGAQATIATAIETFGRVDIVVNNAGTWSPLPFGNLTLNDFQAMLDVHTLGAVRIIQNAWPHMLDQGYGRIVNTVSEAMFGMLETTSYGLAKGAVYGFTRNLAAECGTTGILANCIAPRAASRMGMLAAVQLGTAMGLTSEQMEMVRAHARDVLPSQIPAEAVSPVVAFLAHESCQLNGEILQAASGQVTRLAMMQSTGFSTAATALTPEDVVEHLSEILDLNGGRVRGLMDQSG